MHSDLDLDLDLESTDSLLLEKEFAADERNRSTKRPWLPFLFGLILGLVPLVVVWYSVSKGEGLCGNSNPNLQYNPIPEFPTEIRTFEWNYTMTALRSPESDAAWNSLLPFGRGYVFIPSPKTYSLAPGEDTPSGGGIYSVALYHQLHCLSIIRRDYFDLLEGVWNNATNLREEAFKQIDNSHNRHCMDYIRQTMECNADMTIEWERTEPDGRRFQVDGMHIPHVCKKRSAVNEFMQQQKRIVAEERKSMPLKTEEHMDHGHTGHDHA